MRDRAHFGRPGTPTDQAWIESLFSHIKAGWPHLDAIDNPAVLRTELPVVRVEYNTIRLHAGIGYVTPDDEHEGRGPAIRTHAAPACTAPANTAPRAVALSQKHVILAVSRDRSRGPWKRRSCKP